jgi:hypothetical protein
MSVDYGGSSRSKAETWEVHDEGGRKCEGRAEIKSEEQKARRRTGRPLGRAN